MIRKKSLAIIILMVLCSLCVPSLLFAESIFLSDGSIVEGKIIEENDIRARISLPNSIIMEIPRKQIRRILYSNDYKKRVYIYLLNETVIVAHVVDESKKGYTYRKDLNSSKEKFIEKSKVNFISKKIVDAYRDKIKIEEKKQEKLTRAPKSSSGHAIEQNNILLAGKLSFNIGMGNYYESTTLSIGTDLLLAYFAIDGLAIGLNAIIDYDYIKEYPLNDIDFLLGPSVQYFFKVMEKRGTGTVYPYVGISYLPGKKWKKYKSTTLEEVYNNGFIVFAGAAVMLNNSIALCCDFRYHYNQTEDRSYGVENFTKHDMTFQFGIKGFI